MTDPEVIFSDGQVVVISKPSGMVVNEAQSVKELTVQKWFSDQLELSNSNLEFQEKGGVVHRLDKDTSGVMVLAKTPNAYDDLKQQFLERRVVKKYLALVHGELKNNSGLISLPIERHPKNCKKFTIGRDLGRMAVTEWKTIQKLTIHNSQFTLLELTPHTGRTHQLRVHLRHLGHPVVSDPIYGYAKKWRDDLEWCPRLFLHARSLELIHPVTGEKMSFEALLPEELEKVLHST